MYTGMVHHDICPACRQKIARFKLALKCSDETPKEVKDLATKEEVDE
jgi:hypothetical protein